MSSEQGSGIVRQSFSFHTNDEKLFTVQNLSATVALQNVIGNRNMTKKVKLKLITNLVTLHYATYCIPFYHQWKHLQNFALITLTSISESLRLGERFHHSAEI